MIDNRLENDNTLGRFRSKSDLRDNQICYFPSEGNDRRYVKYVAKEKTMDSNIFEIFEITGTTMCGEKYKRDFVKDEEDLFNETSIKTSTLEKDNQFKNERSGGTNTRNSREIFRNGEKSQKRP